MMTEKEGREMYGVEAIKCEFKQDTFHVSLSKKFNEAICVLKLMYYWQVMQHYKSLIKRSRDHIKSF